MDKYIKIKELGEGSFGRVYLMREKKPGGRLVCVKEIHHVHGTSAAAEGQLMRKLRHPNLIRYLDSFRISHGHSKRQYIVMEYCSGGDLKAYLQTYQKKMTPTNHLSEDKVWFWFLQLCLGLHHMHEHRILHRDIKTSNIFLSNDGFLVLGDFGIARDLRNDEMASTIIGTPLYMAPEMLDGKAYVFSSDCWALGCVLYELCTGSPPFQAANTPALINKICHGKYAPLPKNMYSARIQELITALLSTDPTKRPSMETILRHSDSQVHLKRYLQDRLAARAKEVSSTSSNSVIEDQWKVLIKQMQSFGVDVTTFTAKEGDSGANSIDVVSSVPISSSQMERQSMVIRERERQEQLLVALEKLQQIRLDSRVRTNSVSDGQTSGHAHADGAIEQCHLPGPTNGWQRDVANEIKWRDPVMHPRSQTKIPTNLCIGKNSVVFSGVPRKGVPLTAKAKAFAAKSPACPDVRVLRKQELARATERYKQQLVAASPSKKMERASVDRDDPFDRETDAAILLSIAELRNAMK